MIAFLQNALTTIGRRRLAKFGPGFIGFLIPWLMVLFYLVEVEGHGKTPPTFRLSDIFVRLSW